MAKQARKSSTRNSVLANGVRNLSRSAAYKASGRWNKKMTKKTTAPAKQAEAPAAKKAGKWYPTGTVQTPLPSNKANKAAARVRPFPPFSPSPFHSSTPSPLPIPALLSSPCTEN